MRNNLMIFSFTQLHTLEEVHLAKDLLKYPPKMFETSDEFFVVHNDLYN
jgi:hypothetical protein